MTPRRTRTESLRHQEKQSTRLFLALPSAMHPIPLPLPLLEERLLPESEVAVAGVVEVSLGAKMVFPPTRLILV